LKSWFIKIFRFLVLYYFWIHSKRIFVIFILSSPDTSFKCSLFIMSIRALFLLQITVSIS
jgi:hypothetical protein